MSLTRKEKAPMQEHQGCRAIRLNFRIQSRSSCASAELYPARESPPILPAPVNLSIPPPHYSHFDPTIPLILIRPQQLQVGRCSLRAGTVISESGCAGFQPIGGGYSDDLPELIFACLKGLEGK